MRWLALARYRSLLSIRSTGLTGEFWVSLIAILLPLLWLISAWLVHKPYMPRMISSLYHETAPASSLLFMLHTLTLLGICCSFGMSRRRPESGATSDLIETAPVTASSVYWGDAIGIFVAAMTVQLCLLPLLAVGAALTPFSGFAIAVLEAGTVSVVWLTSCLAAWSLRAKSGRWSLARTLRGGAVVLITVAIAALLVSRGPQLLGTALAELITRPSEETWIGLLGAVRSPAMAVTVLAAVYAAIMTFFFVHSVRRPTEV